VDEPEEGEEVAEGTEKNSKASEVDVTVEEPPQTNLE